MMKYQFKAKDLKTGEWIIGDLAYAETIHEIKKIKPMIVKHYIHGGILYITKRHLIDESTLLLIVK